jgi:ABC-type cobalt transport system substrate-binding protein
MINLIILILSIIVFLIILLGSFIKKTKWGKVDKDFNFFPIKENSDKFKHFIVNVCVFIFIYILSAIIPIIQNRNKEYGDLTKFNHRSEEHTSELQSH